MAVADRVLCMLEGRIVLERGKADVSREEITQAYFGLRKVEHAGGRAAMINQLVQGVLLGGYYALIACGLSFMFSVMRIINLAHGSLAVLAAFGLWLLAERFGIQPFLGLADRAAGHGGDRLGAAALSARAQRARRRAAADPHHLRAGDRHRQPAVRSSSAPTPARWRRTSAASPTIPGNGRAVSMSASWRC